MRSNAPQVVTCNDYQREVAVSQNIAGKHIDRVFTFDKVKLGLKLFCFLCFFKCCLILFLKFGKQLLVDSTPLFGFGAVRI